MLKCNHEKGGKLMDEAERQRRFRDADEQNTARRAAILGARYRDMRGEEDIMPLAEGVMDVADMYKFRIVPLVAGSEERAAIYGITLSTPESRLKEINDEAATKAENVGYYLISDSAFRALMRRYDPPPEVVYSDVQISDKGSSQTITEVSQTLDEVRADDILNYLISQADSLGASDIHLENERGGVRVRFRVDGTLHPIATLTHDKYRILFSSIASAANLSTASTEAQSGHIVREISELTKGFRTASRASILSQPVSPTETGTSDNENGEEDFHVGEEVEIQNENENPGQQENLENQETSDNLSQESPVDQGSAENANAASINDGHHTLNMRIETVPTSYGQDAVIRLFNFRAEMLDMDFLGLSDDEKVELEEIISHPRGMVMVVGPTGSGKSTTLYSILNALNQPTRKLLTLEDPVEFDIPGVSQIPVDTSHGQTFADNVRTILRLDPDIVMVGEIRDEDTARTAIQAAITGHLLLATFHAQDAAAAFSRMIDMIGINPVFATAIRLVIGQRLVRKLDDATKIEYAADESEKKWIREALSGLPKKALNLLPDDVRDESGELNLDNLKLWKPGTSAENPFGFHGRTVLMEQLIVNDEIAGFLRGDVADVSTPAIEKSARGQGMVTMLQKGVLKALHGETTLDEVSSVL
ncbi:Flp pilus assembly complex ATPase component TadA [Candidatus Saccharibacteria bacterium]|nr:Flp pilus assembly complex ATPase component TadA [Candidatus Saccharibacteria bacterium]